MTTFYFFYFILSFYNYSSYKHYFHIVTVDLMTSILYLPYFSL